MAVAAKKKPKKKVKSNLQPIGDRVVVNVTKRNRKRLEASTFLRMPRTSRLAEQSSVLATAN